MSQHSASTRPGDFNVFARTEEVLALHDDPSQEGRPLFMLLGGAGLAMISLTFIGAIIYRTWYAHEFSSERGYFAVSLLFVFYVLGVFLFSYAYELYDTGAAFRMTLVVSMFSVAVIFVVIFALILLPRMKAGASAVAGTSGTSRADDSVVGLVASFLGGGDRDERDLAYRMSTGTAPLLINCLGCGELFTPVPPRAECSHCGRPAVGA